MATLDKSQFELLFKTEISRLHNFARQFVQDSDVAMDLCQNVFMTLWEKRDSIDPDRSMRSYLYTSTKNRCLNFIRDHKKYRSKVLDLDCVDFEEIAESASTDTQELEMKIQSALAALPEKCRQVFELSRFGEMKYREIAETLQISQKTVEAHMSRAIRQLRTSLGDYKTMLWLIFYFFHVWQ